MASWDPYTRGCPSRDLLDQIGGKRAVLVPEKLGKHGACRFTRLRQRLAGVSEKMLTQTLRTLERDGWSGGPCIPRCRPASSTTSPPPRPDPAGTTARTHPVVGGARRRSPRRTSGVRRPRRGHRLSLAPYGRTHAAQIADMTGSRPELLASTRRGTPPRPPAASTTGRASSGPRPTHGYR
ncbi:winged helix-turn-helix transcriptional regulator [Streptomyces racemochromogenes]|uniref:Winged helix-turn-helix transcriptional regulator n=1 Tax=Streptomyces racemochromogenes TaxID=67353 RepID=A0ABW7PDG5_9ACTN